MKVAATGSGDCSTWGNACTLQTALGTGSCTEIWAEKGVYLPTTTVVASPTTADRQKTFSIPSGVAVYGGFAGTEILRGERNPAANVTVLSGDIDDNDVKDANGIDQTVDTANNGGNSNTVVTMDGTSTPVTSSTVLDGFTVTGGNATGNGIAHNSNDGGGLNCDGHGTAAAECSPMLSNLTFAGNTCIIGGGALYLDGELGGASSPTIMDVTFSGNGAPVAGALGIDGGFSGNSNPALVNVTFNGNQAFTVVGYGPSGAGGAVLSDASGSGTSNPSFTNVTFSGNTAERAGGAMFFNAASGSSSPALVSVIAWGDSAPTPVDGPEILNSGTTATISYSDIEGSGGSASWDTSLGTDGGGNLDVDPLLGPLQNNGGFTDTMALLPGSPAIDAGDDGSCPATDQRGIARPQGLHCDIGAYEAMVPVTAIPTLSPWALILLALGLAVAATPMLLRRG